MSEHTCPKCGLMDVKCSLPACPQRFAEIGRALDAAIAHDRWATPEADSAQAREDEAVLDEMAAEEREDRRDRIGWAVQLVAAMLTRGSMPTADAAALAYDHIAAIMRADERIMEEIPK